MSIRLVRHSSGGSWSERGNSLPSHGRHLSRSTTTNRSVGSGNLDGFDWGVGFDQEANSGGILPYPSETESAVVSAPNSPYGRSLSPTLEEDSVAVDPLPLLTPATIRFGLCLVWNVVATCLAFVSIDFFGPIGPLVFATLILPPIVLGVRSTWSIVVTFARYAASLDAEGGRASGEWGRLWVQQRRALGNLMVRISQDPKRWGLISCVCCSLSGLTCIFGGFAVGFWEIKRLALAVFTSLILIPFSASAGLAVCYVIMGCVGCGLQCFRGRYSPNACVHGLGGCIAGSAAVSTHPRRFAFLAFQAIVLIVVVAAGTVSGWSKLMTTWINDTVFLSFGMFAFLAPFAAYGILVEYLFVMGCIGWVCRRMDNNTSTTCVDSEVGELSESVGSSPAESSDDEGIPRIQIIGVEEDEGV